MSEYAAVSSSSYDIDSLVAKLNERAAAGWDVVSVVSTGGEVSAILRRDGTNGAAAEAPAAVAEPEPDPVTEVVPEAVDTWTPEPEPEPEPVAVVTPPVIDTPTIAPVQEPAGWGTADVTPTPEPAPTPEPTPVSPIEVSAPQVAVPVNPAPVVTTPAGWYPDPSGRFEMRYWDGTAWTEHVSRQGQQFTDPPVA
jgi:Protein of unknown function (DUF2510)